ncbi:hypothetical protein GCM10010862_03760 [Devosia nitrariae]|uniref:Uncharacterized protein n=1 Tax=Devosia nitrariae TaxID=2071872 RepID=A0ABQ5VZT9_9HYPH|nr:hypothetical protein GCM10010862_03760 [Devosia nitrariae]
MEPRDWFSAASAFIALGSLGLGIFNFWSARRVAEPAVEMLVSPQPQDGRDSTRHARVAFRISMDGAISATELREIEVVSPGRAQLRLYTWTASGDEYIPNFDNRASEGASRLKGRWALNLRNDSRWALAGLWVTLPRKHRQIRFKLHFASKGPRSFGGTISVQRSIDWADRRIQ